MMRLGLIISLCFLLSISLMAQSGNVIPGALYIKINRSENQRNAFQLESITGFQKATPLRKINPNQRAEKSILDGLYKVQVHDTIDIMHLCRLLNSSVGVQYAEPIYAESLLYIPNDPDATNGNQEYLSVIKAFEAWDITKGSKDIIIGISDTGLDFDNPDIKNKLYTNTADPYNGIDDDGNGFIDDYQGWDFGDNDSLAAAEVAKHGTGVGGLAAGEVDNGFGIAGVGYLSSLVSLKVHNTETKTINTGYESILYAADNGYDIINLSWGTPGFYSRANQDIITYAAVEKNVVVVAAAGNTPDELDFYPASYEHVLSVAATNLDDTKAGFSTYSHHVDLCAPGNNIYTIGLDSSFFRDNGTSYSSPLVAGAAALVKAQFPTLNALQIAERLRVSADTIYGINDEKYKGKLGFGRLNVLKAVSSQNLKSIRIEQITHNNHGSQLIFPEDTISISFTIKNYLDPIQNGILSFSIESAYASILSQEIEIGKLATLDSKIGAVQLLISADAPAEASIPIRLVIKDSTDYVDFQYLKVVTAPAYHTLDNGKVKMTLGANGRLGFNNDEFFDGEGLKRNEMVYAGRMGVGIVDQLGNISDGLPTFSTSHNMEEDFRTTATVRYERSSAAPIALYQAFDDSLSDNPMQIALAHHMYTDYNSDFLIQDYTIINHRDTANIFNFGYFMDWSIPPTNYKNRIVIDEATQTAVAFHSNNMHFAGIRTIHDRHPIIQSLDIAGFSNNSADIPAILNDSIKKALFTKPQFDHAGVEGDGNDVATLIIADSIFIPAGQSSCATFLIAFGNTREDLMANLDRADSLYQLISSVSSSETPIISCVGATEALTTTEKSMFFSDPFGFRSIAIGSEAQINIASDTTIYYTSFENDRLGKFHTVEYQVRRDLANFHMSVDTLYLDGEINSVHFEENCFEPAQWQWDFGNGQQSKLPNPSMNYFEAGNYWVNLRVTTSTGCVDTLSKLLTVASRPEKPTYSDIHTCNFSASFQAENVDAISFYASINDENPVKTGHEIALENITRDTTIYISNLKNGFESLKQAVRIFIDHPGFSFEIKPDTTSTSTSAQFELTSTDIESIRWYLDENLVSTAPLFNFSISKSSYDLGLVLSNNAGCEDSIYQRIQFSESPLPSLSFTQPCKGSSLSLSPSNGNVFGFYRDSILTQLISKGNSVFLDQITEPQRLYIVGLDSILSGNVLSVNVIPKQPEVKILAKPDTLFLEESYQTKFSLEGDDISKAIWYVNDLAKESSSSPILFFAQPGTYEIKCRVSDLQGCTNTDSITYLVESRRFVITNLERDSRVFIFPNPASEELNIIADDYYLIEVTDLAGKVLINIKMDKSTKIDLSHISSGTYLLRATNQYKTISSRLLIYR